MHELLLDKNIWEKTFKRLATKYGETSVEYQTLSQMFDSEEYRNKIVTQIMTGEFKFSIPRKISIAKSGTNKKRVVYMYTNPERVVQSVMYRALAEYFSDRLKDNCFSYRKGVTTLNAIQYIAERTDISSSYGMKFDIQAYFNSVSFKHLNEVFIDLFDNRPELDGFRKTLETIYYNDVVLENGKLIVEYKSLVAGSPLGSFFANVCLSKLDEKYINRKDVVYARYSDDILILCPTQEILENTRSEIEEELKLLDLKLNPKKYVSFDIGEPVDYLGLELGKGYIDISKHAKDKVKRTIKRWVKKERVKIEKGEISFNRAMSRLIKRYNHRMFKTFIIDPTKYGWAYYAFRFITTYKSLAEIDLYFMNQLRYLKTGKHNKANGKALSQEDYDNFGFISLVDMYKLFKEDFDYYCEVANLL